MEFKVITPPSSEPVTLPEVRLNLRLTADDTTAEDTLLSAWISAARQQAEHYMGVCLMTCTLEAVCDEFPDDEDDELELPRGPATAITSIKYTDPAGVEQTLSSSLYSLSTYGEARRVDLAYGQVWPSTQDIPNAVRVRYQAGGSSVSQAVKSAILMMVAWRHEHRGDEGSPDDIQPPAAKALLQTEKRWGF